MAHGLKPDVSTATGSNNSGRSSNCVAASWPLAKYAFQGSKGAWDEYQSDNPNMWIQITKVSLGFGRNYWRHIRFDFSLLGYGEKSKVQSIFFLRNRSIGLRMLSCGNCTHCIFVQIPKYSQFEEICFLLAGLQNITNNYSVKLIHLIWRKSNNVISKHEMF